MFKALFFFLKSHNYLISGIFLGLFTLMLVGQLKNSSTKTQEIVIAFTAGMSGIAAIEAFYRAGSVPQSRHE